MDINLEEMKIIEDKLMDDVLYFALSDNYKDELERAKSTFSKMTENTDYSHQNKNFTSWLLWDYRLLNGKNFFQEYKNIKKSELRDVEIKLLDSIANANLSIYEIIKDSDTLKLRDVFLKESYIVNYDGKVISNGSKGLLIARIFNFDGNYLITKDCIFVDKLFKGLIEKNFYEKYEEYKQKYRIASLKKFIQSNSPLIYQFAHIVDELIRNQIENDNEKYKVWQSTYIVTNSNNVRENLLRDENIELSYEEDEIVYFRLYGNNKRKILCEIVLYKNKMELECNSDGDRYKAKKKIQSITGNFLKHVKDEVISIEDLL
jgi:hypothetical protein